MSSRRPAAILLLAPALSFALAACGGGGGGGTNEPPPPPAPTLAAATFPVGPAILSGGSSAQVTLSLPSLTSAATSASSVVLAVSAGGAPAPVTKLGGAPLGAADLGTTVTVAAPATAATEAKTFTYTLTVSNAASPPATASATGTLLIVPVPTLATGTITVAPAAITGGSSPTLSLPLPALTSAAASASAVTLTVDLGSGPLAVTKSGGGAVGAGDLGTTVTVDAPVTLSTDSKTATYTLTVANGATTPATTVASGAVTIVPAVTLGGALTAVPNVIAGGTNTPGLIQLALPTVSAGTAATVSLTRSIGGPGAAIPKSGGGAVTVADLGTTISVDPPATSAADTLTVTYALTASNPAGTPSAPASATVSVLRAQADLLSARAGATATVLPDGRVLVAGGGARFNNGVCVTPSNTAELYDPSSGTASAVPGTMALSRCQHAAVLSGTRVYLFGGASTGTAADRKIDVYDTAASAFVADGTPALPLLAVARIAPTATLLGAASGTNAGRIVIAGGYGGGGAALTSLELFDPASGSLGASTAYSGLNGSLGTGRAEHSATLQGPWLTFVGGSTSSTSVDALDTRVPASANNPIVRTTSPTNAIARLGHGALAVSATRILVAGGMDSTGLAALSSVQLYTVDTTTGGVTAVTSPANLTTARARFALLPAGPLGRYLALGGTTASATTDAGTSSVELIDASGATPAIAASGSLRMARVAPAAAQLPLAGASTAVLLLSGGGTATGGTEIVVGP